MSIVVEGSREGGAVAGAGGWDAFIRELLEINAESAVTLFAILA